MASIKPEKGLRPMNVKRIIRRVTDNDYLFTIFTKILAVLFSARSSRASWGASLRCFPSWR